MTRRDLLQGVGAVLAADQLAGAAPAEQPTVFPGTQPLTWEGDLADRMMDGAHEFVQRKIDESIASRQKYWNRDFSSHVAYEKSVEPNRTRFRKIIGVVDARVPVVMERFGDEDNPALVSETEAYRVYQVRWPVLEGVFGEGLLLEPKGPIRARVVSVPDAPQTPEQLAGQSGYRLAENGFEVVIPTLIDLGSRWAGHPEIRMTPQTHREWIYRQAYHMGRHVIGYEVQKVLAAVDWFQRKDPGGKIGVTGYGEGGLIAFYAAAVDIRIDAALVSGYFGSRQAVASEPIYRNVWSLLHEFGDAEIATLVAPRGLVVESVGAQAEFDRIDELTRPGFQPRQLVSTGSLQAFAGLLGFKSDLPFSGTVPIDGRRSFDPGERQKRQVRALEGHVQGLVRASEHTREKFFLYKVAPEFTDETFTRVLRHPTYSPAKFIEASKPYRKYFWEEVLGKFEEPLLPPNARTRKVFDKEKWTGYEVVLDVWPEVFAWGILLVPKDLKPGERRPVVVCQHGRRGIPTDVVMGDDPYYHDFAAKLAEQGFITFAPHNLYRGEERYRTLSRKANGVKASLFSFIISQHDQILRWLGTLPMVDSKRIAFYGLSYGGETAVRVPTILEGYCLSICSGDFNNWVRKVAATDERFSFMYSIEWEMPYFDMGSTFDYAEMAYLILPRPFMVERGHWDQVGRDQWVAHEYAKVAWLYAQFGLADRTEIEYFNGGHTINGEGTFRFLHKHLS
jgi:dienelactone hydrolase